jgi:nitroimidazol reductase NimA-like FMN-containing flavoprotein (pyridoxamine 5'-phosphate oxidase superfamily)
MPEVTGAGSRQARVPPGPGNGSGTAGGTLETLDEAECLRLISPGGIGRLAYSGRYGLTVFPVNYRLHEGAIVFRIAAGSPAGEDLRTGIANADYQVAFEVDDVDQAARQGWSVLVQGPAHHMTSEAEQASVRASGVEPWPAGPRDHAIRITPARVTGRRLTPP